MTTIRYFIPEDGDSEQHLNVFLAPKSRNSSGVPTLGEIKNAFPLPGRYHFRFKSPLLPGGDREKNAVAVWMDCIDDRQSIPVWQNAIIAKVSRVGVEDDDDDDDDDEDEDADFCVRTSSMPTQANIPHTSTSNHLQPPATNPNPMMDMFDAPLMSGSAPAGVSHNLLDVPHTSLGNETLLDMSIPHAATSSTPYGHAYPSHSAAPASSTDHDFFGMATTGPPQTSPTPLPSSNAYGGNNIPYPHTPAPNSGNNNVNAYGGNYSQQQQGPFGGLGTPWNS